MGDGKGVVLLKVAFQVVGLEPFIEDIFPENLKTLLQLLLFFRGELFQIL
jgi:hypothetical protein